MRLSLFFPSLRIIILLILTISLVSVFSIHADNPSPNGWNLSGGGFCPGTYTIFNTTLTPNPGLYAENCATGKNDFYSATDFGALFNSVRGAIETTGQGEIDIRPGFYAETTTAIISSNALTSCKNAGFCLYGLTVKGSGHGHAGYGTPCCQINGTMIVAKTASMTMFAMTSQSGSVTCSASGCTGGSSVQGLTLENFALIPNSLASIGMNLAEKETGGTNNIVRDMTFGQYSGTGFTTALIMDGNEDAWLEDSVFLGAGTLGSGGAATDVQWQVPVGNVNIIHVDFGGVVHLAAWAQSVSVSQTTINSIKILGTAASLGSVVDLQGDYIANIIGSGIIQLNGQTVSVLKISGSAVRLSSSVPLFSGTGTLSSLDMQGDTLNVGAASNWNPGGSTLTKQTSDGANHSTNLSNCAGGACFTNFPFTIDANGNF